MSHSYILRISRSLERQTCARRLSSPAFAASMYLFSFITRGFVLKACHVCYHEVRIADVSTVFKSAGLVLKTATSTLFATLRAAEPASSLP